MGMQINQSRRNDGAGYLANVAITIGFQIRPDARHLPSRERNVGHSIELLRRIEHMAVLGDEVVGHLNPSVNRASSLHQHPATATRRILKFLRHTDVRFGSLADKAVLPALGITGLSLSLASGATASTGEATTNLPSTSRPQELFL